MIITSDYKDYYDYVQYINGYNKSGKEYVRKDFVENAEYHMPKHSVLPYWEYATPIKNLHHIEYDDDTYCEVSVVIIGEKSFPIVKEEIALCKYKMHIITPEHRFSKLEAVRKLMWELSNVAVKNIEICRKLKNPVLEVCIRREHLLVSNKIPRLGELGFGKIYPAEEIFQDLNYFMDNVMYQEEKHDTMSDKEKVVSHGFDLKNSFRK